MFTIHVWFVWLSDCDALLCHTAPIPAALYLLQSTVSWPPCGEMCYNNNNNNNNHESLVLISLSASKTMFMSMSISHIVSLLTRLSHTEQHYLPELHPSYFLNYQSGVCSGVCRLMRHFLQFSLWSWEVSCGSGDGRVVAPVCGCLVWPVSTLCWSSCLSSRCVVQVPWVKTCDTPGRRVLGETQGSWRLSVCLAVSRNNSFLKISVGLRSETSVVWLPCR